MACGGASLDAFLQNSEDICNGVVFAWSRGCKGISKGPVRIVHVQGRNIRISELCESKQLRAYYVKRVVSPFEFYLEQETSHGYEENVGNHKHKRMQKYYEDQERERIQYSIQVTKNDCYALYDQESDQWWRVRVENVDLESPETMAFVYFCDIGKHKYVSCQMLRELTADFAENNGIILKCYLYDVLPATGTHHWSTEAISFFKELLVDTLRDQYPRRRVGAMVMASSTTLVAEYSPDKKITCGVVLAEKAAYPKYPKTFNWLMVEMGFAKSTGILSGSLFMLDRPGLVPSYDLDEKKEPGQRDQEAETVPRLYPLTPISKEKLREIINKHFGNLDRQDATHNPHLQFEPSEENLPYEIRCRLAWVKFSCIVDPGRIYVHLEKKKPELKAMEESLTRDCDSLSAQSVETLKQGDFVACSLPGQRWARALVLKTQTENDRVRILLLDYGTTVWSISELVRPLPIKYRQIPSFVHRIHLTNFKPTKGISKWSADIGDVLRRYVLSHEPSKPLYFLHLADRSDNLLLGDINQKVRFIDATNRWITDHSTRLSTDSATVNALAGDPLVATHFYSNAVQVLYEEFTEPMEFWKFSELGDFLVKTEFAEKIDSAINKMKLHKSISKGFGKF